jgi:molybdate transport repressor ModE-like protein
MIDPQRLRVLREVARQGSIAGAARHLRLTPSAVSQQISALERSVGLPVVERSTRGVTLTEPGRLLYGAADAVEAELGAVTHQLARLTEGSSGRVCVAAFSSAGRPLLAPALAGLGARLPDVQVDVVEAEPDEALALLRSGRVDLAVVYRVAGPRAAGPLDWTALWNDPLRLLVPDDHPLAGRAVADLAACREDRWVLGQGQCLAVSRAVLAGAGVEPKVACNSGDYAFLQALVAIGMGLALVYELAVDDVPGVSTLRLPEPAPHRVVEAVMTRRHWTNPAAVVLRDLLVERAALLDESNTARATSITAAV